MLGHVPTNSGCDSHYTLSPFNFATVVVVLQNGVAHVPHQFAMLLLISVCNQLLDPWHDGSLTLSILSSTINSKSYVLAIITQILHLQAGATGQRCFQARYLRSKPGNRCNLRRQLCLRPTCVQPTAASARWLAEDVISRTYGRLEDGPR